MKIIHPPRDTFPIGACQPGEVVGLPGRTLMLSSQTGKKNGTWTCMDLDRGTLVDLPLEEQVTRYPKAALYLADA